MNGVQEEFNEILKERDVVLNLNKLEDIITAARYRKSQLPLDSQPSNRQSNAPEIIPPHTQPPQALLRAHLSPHLNAQRSVLNAKLQTVESLNAELGNQIQGQNRRIGELVKGLEGLVGDLEGANKELGEMEGLGRIGREGEEGLR